MAESKKTMLEVTKTKMTSALSAEHQRKWDESRWECKLDDPERNYDKSRVHLNFEIRKDGVIAPVDKSVCIKEKVDKRIAEWKAERLAQTGKEPIVRSTQHKSVCIIMGGNRERMNELAFGNQVLQERGQNSHIQRMKEIELFAIDNYNALAKRIGEKNIISFIVHCDEKNCHIHATIVPILEDGRLSAKDMFGGGSLVSARDKMREWHDWYATVNEKWGLERGDDIHETGARHKSLEEHNRELHRENKSLEEELETKRRAMKGLSTMIENLTRRQEEIQSQIAELEAQQQESDSNKEYILRQIKSLNQTLSDIRVNLREKKGKLDQVNHELDILKSAYETKQKGLDAIMKKNNVMINYINTDAEIILKASILDQVLYEAAQICREIPKAEAMAEDTFIDDRNFLRFNDVLDRARRVFLAGLDGATNVAPSSGGGGTSNDMPWRDKDEDYLHYARRAMLYAHAKCYPGSRFKRMQNR
jgi:hypothetical protein